MHHSKTHTPPARIEWLDAARGAVIVLVVVGHAIRGLQLAGVLPLNGVWHALDRAIYAFHMPLMFMLSGMFLLSASRAPAPVFIKGRLRRLVWPLFLWTYIFFAIKILAGDHQNAAIGVDSFPWFPLPPRLHFWFLWALFLCSCAVWLLRWIQLQFGLADRPFWGAVLGAAVLIPVLYHGRMSPWLAQAVQHFPFLIAGILLPHGLGQGARIWQVVLVAALVAVIDVSIAVSGWSGPWVYLLGGLSLSLLVCYLFASVSTLGGGAPLWLRRLGVASMAVYLSHTIVAGAGRAVLFALGVQSAGIHLLVAVIAGLVIPACVYFAIRGTRL